MANVTDAQLGIAETRGREMPETEPRAAGAHYGSAAK